MQFFNDFEHNINLIVANTVLYNILNLYNNINNIFYDTFHRHYGNQSSLKVSLSVRPQPALEIPSRSFGENQANLYHRPQIMSEIRKLALSVNQDRLFHHKIFNR